jgi:CheY-like chemotaxis protein
MAHGLDILLIDDHSGGDRVLSDALTQHGRQILTVTTVRAGVVALERARITGSRFSLVVGNVADLATDGLALMRELQRCQDAVPVVLTADYSTVDPQVVAEAQRLGVRAILDTPVDPAQVVDTLAQVEVAAAEAGRIGLALEPIALPPQRQLHESLLPPRVMVQRQQTTGRFQPGALTKQRRSLDTPLPIAPHGGAARRLTPLPQPTAAAAAAAAVPPDPEKVRRVICGACNTVIRVEIKSSAYTTLCVYCGGMLRVEPG